MIKRILFATLFAVFEHGSANAAVPSCTAFAEQAAREHGIPANLLSAISIVETRHQGKPWPWTLNEGGKSFYFATKEEALRYLTDAVGRGVRNIDVGCMQLNFHWHAAGFSSLEAMLDPKKNTNYAALFLLELKRRVGSWEEATSHYHSSDEARGNTYSKKVVAATDQVFSDEPGGKMITSELSLRADIAAAEGGPIVQFEKDGMKKLDALLSRIQVSEPVVRRLDGSDDMRKFGELPPRLGRRWDELQRVRRALAGKP